MAAKQKLFHIPVHLVHKYLGEMAPKQKLVHIMVHLVHKYLGEIAAKLNLFHIPVHNSSLTWARLARRRDAATSTNVHWPLASQAH